MWVRQAPKNFKEKGTCPSITLWCAIKAGKNRLCVKASATTLCVRRGISLTILALTNSRTKYRRISICLENFRSTGFLLISIQAKLSSKMSVSVDCGYPKSRSVSRRYTTFWAAWIAATNSASEVERKTLSCRQLVAKGTVRGTSDKAQWGSWLFSGFSDDYISIWPMTINLFRTLSKTPIFIDFKCAAKATFLIYYECSFSNSGSANWSHLCADLGLYGKLKRITFSSSLWE